MDSNESITEALFSVGAQLARVIALMEAQVGGDEHILDIAVGAGAGVDRVVSNTPGAGYKRFVTRYKPQGLDAIPLASGVATDIVGATVARIGGTIVNYGTVPVILYLDTAQHVENGVLPVGGQGIAALWLSANGGSWDFKLSNSLWAGPVSAVAQAGAGVVSLAVT